MSTVEIIVTYVNGDRDRFQVGSNGWHVYVQTQCLIVRDHRKTIIPLSGVRSFTVEDIEPTTEEPR